MKYFVNIGFNFGSIINIQDNFPNDFKKFIYDISKKIIKLFEFYETIYSPLLGIKLKDLLIGEPGLIISEMIKVDLGGNFIKTDNNKYKLIVGKVKEYLNNKIFITSIFKLLRIVHLILLYKTFS
jgi:hypothetical protein